MAIASTLDDAPTAIATGVIAAVLASFAHETLGHGFTCLAEGGRITLLTSVYFHCHGATALTDAAGPLGNVVAAVVSLLLLSTKAASRPVSRLFLTYFAGLNLFWFTGYIVYSGVLNIGDLAFVARDLGWIPAWRPLAVVVGVVLYIRSSRLMSTFLRDLAIEGEPARKFYRRVAMPYIAGVLSAACAGLLWRKDPWGGAMEAVLAVGIAPASFCLATWRAGKLGWRGAPMTTIARSWRWIAVSGILFVLFAAIQARGIGPLS